MSPFPLRCVPLGRTTDHVEVVIIVGTVSAPWMKLLTPSGSLPDPSKSEVPSVRVIRQDGSAPSARRSTKPEVFLPYLFMTSVGISPVPDSRISPLEDRMAHRETRATSGRRMSSSFNCCRMLDGMTSVPPVASLPSGLDSAHPTKSLPIWSIFNSLPASN